MGRDFKHRVRHPRSREAEAAPAMPGWIWLLVGFGLGLLVMLYLVFKNPAEPGPAAEKVVQNVAPPASQEPPKEAPAAKKPADKPKPPEPVQPKYQFYTILPEAEVVVPEAEANKGLDSVPLQQAPGTQPTTSQRYLLQAGSFRNLSDAEKHKAKLALLGIQASIEKVSVDNTLWHRVRIGPFKSIDEVSKVKTQLQSQNIPTLLVQIAN